MLEIRDLHVKFHSRAQEAVGGISLTIRNGEILGLVGESGSGKSVTAMSVAGLLPRRSCDYSGQILLDGVEMLHADRSKLRKIQGNQIGVVFQEPMSAMDPLMKVGTQVEEVLSIHTSFRRRNAVPGHWRLCVKQSFRTRKIFTDAIPMSFPVGCCSGP